MAFWRSYSISELNHNMKEEINKRIKAEDSIYHRTDTSNLVLRPPTDGRKTLGQKCNGMGS